MNEDFLDLFRCLHREGARYLVVGAHAMAVHGVPRATGDLDVWIDPAAPNPSHAWRALLDFGAPVAALGIDEGDLTTPGTVVQIGVPPRRIDLMTSVSGLAFEDAWPGRVLHRLGDLEVPFLGRADLVRNKRATGRSKDLVDIETLEAQDT